VKWERRYGKVRRSIRRRNVGTVEGPGNSDRVPTRIAGIAQKTVEIILFADNTSSVEARTKGNPGPSQQISQKFVETATTLLNENKRVSIEVSWVPGHIGIEGNDRADEIAKEATELEPATGTTTIAKLHRQLREELKAEWIREWANKPMTGRYAIVDRYYTTVSGRITCVPHT